MHLEIHSSKKRYQMMIKIICKIKMIHTKNATASQCENVQLLDRQTNTFICNTYIEIFSLNE